MKKVPAYNEPRTLAWATETYFTKKSERYADMGQGLGALAKILPSERIFALFGERIAADLPGNLRTLNQNRNIYETFLAKGKSVEFQARLAALFHRQVLPQLSDEERVSFFISPTHNEYSYVFPQSQRRDNYSLGILKQRGQLLGDPRLEPLQKDYRAAMQTIWDNRGYYGTLDLILLFNSTDWDSIFAVLGIDPQAGRSQLRQAVKKFSQTPAYAALVQTIQNGNSHGIQMLKLGAALGKVDDPLWLDDTLGPYLTASPAEAFKSDSELASFSRRLFAGAYYSSQPDTFQRAYSQALTGFLKSPDPTGLNFERFTELHRGIMESLVGGAHIPIKLAGSQAEAIDRSPLPAETKKELLRAIFLEGYPESIQTANLTFEWAGAWLAFDKAGAKTVAQVLIRNGLASGTADLFRALLSRDDFRSQSRKYGFSKYASAVSAFKTELLSELNVNMSAARSPQEQTAALLGFLETVIDPADGDYESVETVNTPEIREMKARAAALASRLDLSFTDHLAIFRRLTGSGATPATDTFFQKRLEPIFASAAAEAAGLPLSLILEKDRIAGAGLQLALTRKLLEPEIKRLEGSPQDPEALNRLIETINAYVRQGSLKKDEFLEDLAWRLELSGRELGAFIEDEKSYNWRKANPMLMRFGSALSAEISRLSAASRGEFIRFLIEPEGRELPPVILKELRQSLYSAALAAARASTDLSSPADIREGSDRAADLMRLEIENALIDASPFERIPLFELLLSAGDRALQKSADFPYNVTREFLKYEPDSKEEKMLVSYLTVVPAHEKTVSLAYLLSQAGDNKTSVKHIFEVFQTVGVKFGQMSAIWKIFGEEVARQTASLKNAARPMSKDEIMAAAQRELTPEEFARVKHPKKVIGSASLKTVVLVELTDGREVVMMLRRPHAAEQIASNLQLSQNFLRELDRQGLSSASTMFNAVLDAVRQQLADELKFTRKAEQIRAAQKLFSGLNSTLAEKMQGWRFQVPGLVEGFQPRDTILFMEKAAGKS
ncbi:MAG: AarF/UbiB family protein, partial [Elusimicrobiota bacterium]